MPRLENSADSSQARLCACVVLTSTALQASSVGTRFRSDASTSGARTPYGLYNSLSTLHVGCSPACVLTPERAHQSTDSAQRARLDTGGWLNLTRRGLSPRKVLQASLVALTPLAGETKPEQSGGFAFTLAGFVRHL